MRAVFICYRENCGSILGLFISGAQAEHIVCIYRANGTVTLQKAEVIAFTVALTAARNHEWKTSCL